MAIDNRNRDFYHKTLHSFSSHTLLSFWSYANWQSKLIFQCLLQKQPNNNKTKSQGMNWAGGGGRIIFKREPRLTSAMSLLFSLFSFTNYPKSTSMFKLGTKGKAFSVIRTPSLSRILLLKVNWTTQFT